VAVERLTNEEWSETAEIEPLRRDIGLD